MSPGKRVSQGKRRGIAAYLSERHDGDLLPWVEQLVAAGRLADTIKQGLRLARYFADLPGGEEFLRRGILAEAVRAGVYAVGGVGAVDVARGVPARRTEGPGSGLGPVAGAGSGAGRGAAAEVAAGPGPGMLEEALDRTLGGV